MNRFGKALFSLTLFSLAMVLASPLSAQDIFWDEPEFLVRQGGRFPTTVDNGQTAAVFWQERRTTEGWTQSFVSLAVRRTGDPLWTVHRQVLGPFTVTGTEAQLYSAVVDASGVFWVATLAEGGQVVVYRSEDGQSFREDGVLSSEGNLLAPRIFLGPDGPLVIANRADANSFRLVLSRRSGLWPPFQVVTPEENQRQSFEPSLAWTGSRLVLVYQSQFTAAATQTEGRRVSYQVYRRDSLDGGATWGGTTRLSDFADELSDNPDAIDNQRPRALWFADRLFVTWERRTAQTQPQVEVASWSPEGRRLDAQALTATNYTARNPQFFTYRDRLRLSWFDNRNESYDVFLSSWDPRPEVGWASGDQLTRGTGNSVFGQPARLGDDLYFVWQSNFGDNPGVVLVQPDKRVDAPSLRARNFNPEVSTKNPAFTVEVGYPKDMSGIAGFNVLLSQDPEAQPGTERRLSPRDRLWTQTVEAEGTWYLSVRVVDGAGNWSGPTRLPLRLKTTPPGVVVFDSPETDARGYLTSNTFSLSWKPTTDDAVGYSWRLTRVGDGLTQGLLASLKVPEPTMGPGAPAQASATNLEDGLWALSVAAFDEAGNRGATANHFFRLNKFRPYTVLASVDTQQDEFGRVALVLRGRGFSAGGPITRVYIDQDGQAPFDYELGPDRFHIASDRLIDGIAVEGLAEGVYRVGVGHPERGRVFSGPVLRVEPTGTVKVGDYRDLDQTVWRFFGGITVFFSVHAVYFWVLMVFLGAATWASLRFLVRAWTERLEVARQTDLWFADNPDKWAPGPGRTLMKAKRRSLTVKFAASILSLTGLVILMLSLTLGFFIVENSQRTLGTALVQRTQVLLDSLATGARTYLPTANYNELSNLPQQISAMEGEALWATITGPSTQGRPGLSSVYASNDPDLAAKIDTTSLIPGVSTLSDDVEALWGPLQAELNQKAEAAVGDLVRQIEELTRLSRPLAEKTDAASRAQLVQYEDQNSSLKRQVIARLAEVAGKARSLPEFDTQNLLGTTNKRYVFYQPFLYLTVGDPTYVRGLIRIEVSSQTIEAQILASRDQLIQVTFVVALLALGLGLVGAFLLSAITINPIRKLVAGVEVIRDTPDKTKLEGHSIELNTRDELSELARTVNQMTRGLVDGANRTQDLTKGKVEQKTLFIPLDKDADNQKLTTYHRDFDDIEVFAYYEGAKLVSGDLYEVRQLDTREGQNPKSPWYGIMKGDVSGKGVEAGMVMAIAAMFVTTFFRRWTEAKDARDTKVDTLLYQINDTIEPILAEAGRGLFVALNVGILNAKTGALRFSQAGDNLLHVWRGRTGTFESVDLKKTISVGAMPSSEHRIRYENQNLALQSGDTLLYFTDGSEESQSAYRDENWNPIAYFDPSDPTSRTQPNAEKLVPVFEGGPLRAVKAENTEDFGPHRIEAVVAAYYHREVYRLEKKNWLHPEKTFHFDFSTCDGSAQGLVTALISIDRVFRLVPDPQATDDDVIDLDLVQDAFLKKHFVEYDQYFRNGYQTYEHGDRSKNDVVDRQGYRLTGAKRVPLWTRAEAGQTADAEGYLLVDDERVPLWEKGTKDDQVDAEGYRLVGGRRVASYQKGDPSRNVVDAEGYLLVGGSRILSNPGYIRYGRLKEDHQFDDLTLLAIRKK